MRRSILASRAGMSFEEGFLETSEVWFLCFFATRIRSTSATIGACFSSEASGMGSCFQSY